MSVVSRESIPRPWAYGGIPAPVTDDAQQTRDSALYPESDGKPIAESTLQFEWIETIKGSLEALFVDDPHVFIAADLLWYPVEGSPQISAAPDTMVAFGRPKGHRLSYLQWREEGIAPQVVFEIRSPNNTEREMAAKRAFYQQYGVLEYYDYDSVSGRRTGWWRSDTSQPFAQIPHLTGWVSPLLGIRFGETETGDLRIFRPDGRPFQSFVENERKSEAAERMLLIAEEQRDAAEEARRAAKEQRDAAKEQLDAAVRRAEQLAAQLRALGIDPDTLSDASE